MDIFGRPLFSLSQSTLYDILNVQHMKVLINNDIFFDILNIRKGTECSLKHMDNFFTDEVILNLKMWFMTHNSLNW